MLSLTCGDSSPLLCQAPMNSAHTVCPRSSRQSTFTQVNTLELSCDPLSMVPESLKYTVVILFDKSWLTNLQPSMKNYFKATEYLQLYGLFGHAGLSRESEWGFGAARRTAGDH